MYRDDKVCNQLFSAVHWNRNRKVVNLIVTNVTNNILVLFAGLLTGLRASTIVNKKKKPV